MLKYNTVEEKNRNIISRLKRNNITFYIGNEDFIFIVLKWRIVAIKLVRCFDFIGCI